MWSGCKGGISPPHPEVKDRRRFFGFLTYFFPSAMFGLVFSKNLKWVYFLREITTLCSFFLIGYRNNDPSKEGAFLALWINLLGGVAFSEGIILPAFFSRRKRI